MALSKCTDTLHDEYLVTLLLASLTACKCFCCQLRVFQFLFGVFSPFFLKKKASTSVRLLGRLARTALLKSVHIFLMMFRLNDCEVHVQTLFPPLDVVDWRFWGVRTAEDCKPFILSSFPSFRYNLIHSLLCLWNITSATASNSPKNDWYQQSDVPEICCQCQESTGTVAWCCLDTDANLWCCSLSWEKCYWITVLSLRPLGWTNFFFFFARWSFLFYNIKMMKTLYLLKVDSSNISLNDLQ